MTLINAEDDAASATTTRANGLRLSLSLFVALVAGLPQPAHSEVRVTGDTGDIHVFAQDARVDEVLAALRESFALQYRASSSLNRVISGTYSGSLRRVVADVLRDYDFILQSSDGRLGLVVIGTRSAASQAATTAPPTPEVRRRAREDE